MPNYCLLRVPQVTTFGTTFWSCYSAAHSCSANHCTAPLEQLGCKCTLAVIVMTRKEPHSVSLVRFFSLPSATRARQLRLKIPQCGGGTAPKDPLIHSICRTITNNRSVHVCVRVSNSDGGGVSKNGKCHRELSHWVHRQHTYTHEMVPDSGGKWHLGVFVSVCICASGTIFHKQQRLRFCPLKVGRLCPVSWL